MKILHITKKYPLALGGDAFYVRYLEREQCICGHEVFIFTARLKETICKPNVYQFGIQSKARDWDTITVRRVLSIVLFFLTLPLIIRKVKPHIIHAHAVDLGCLASWWGMIFSCPVVLTCHSVLFPYPGSKIKRWIDFLLLKMGIYHLIVTVDGSSLEYFQQARIAPVIFLPVGVDIVEFDRNYIDTKQVVRKKTRFLFVGRLEKVKGLEYLLRAVKRLISIDNQLEVIIIGEGSIECQLKSLSEKLQISDYVKFVGAVTNRKELVKYYCSSDIFVLPSLREWCPLVLFEAWASEVAVIATKTGSIIKLCRHLENTYLVDPMDEIDLFKGMLTLMQDVALRKKLAKNGRQLVQSYTWQVLCQQLLQLYVS